jgi:hypothetical protein
MRCPGHGWLEHLEAVLYCIQEFKEAAAQLDLAKDDWDLVIVNVQNCIPTTFDAALEQWKSEMILATTWQTWVDHLETLTKPCSMKVESFFNRLKVMACYVNDIPVGSTDTTIHVPRMSICGSISKQK